MLFISLLFIFLQVFMGDQEVSANLYLKNRALSRCIRLNWLEKQPNDSFLFFPCFYNKQKNSIKGDVLQEIVNREEMIPLNSTENLLQKFIFWMRVENSRASLDKRDLLLKLEESPSSVPEFALLSYLCGASGFDNNGLNLEVIDENKVSEINKCIKKFIEKNLDPSNESRLMEVNESEKMKLEFVGNDDDKALQEMKNHFKKVQKNNDSCSKFEKINLYKNSFENLVLSSMKYDDNLDSSLLSQKIGEKKYEVLTTEYLLLEKWFLLKKKFKSFINEYHECNVTCQFIHEYVNEQSDLQINTFQETESILELNNNGTWKVKTVKVNYSSPSTSDDMIRFLKEMEPFGVLAEINLEQACKKWKVLEKIINIQKENKGINRDYEELYIDECAFKPSFSSSDILQPISLIEEMEPILFPVFSMLDFSFGEENSLLRKLRYGCSDVKSLQEQLSHVCLPKNNIPYFQKENKSDNYIKHKEFGVAMSQCYEVGYRPRTPFCLSDPIKTFENEYKNLWKDYNKACLNADSKSNPE